MRMVVKWTMLAADDVVIGAAQIAAIIQYALFFTSISHGLGKDANSMDGQSLSIMGKVRPSQG